MKTFSASCLLVQLCYENPAGSANAIINRSELSLDQGYMALNWNFISILRLNAFYSCRKRGKSCKIYALGEQEHISNRTE